jgi:hypothetical protein
MVVVMEGDDDVETSDAGNWCGGSLGRTNLS